MPPERLRRTLHNCCDLNAPILLVNHLSTCVRLENEGFLDGATCCDLLIYWRNETRLKIKAY